MDDLSRAGVFARSGFLPTLKHLWVLSQFDTLREKWRPSSSLGLLGRGATHQMPSSDMAAQARLEPLRRLMADATLDWHRTCGFALPDTAPVQVFPVLMIGSDLEPPFQPPHVDRASEVGTPPICTSVYYASADNLKGGELALAAVDGGPEAARIMPSTNTIISFDGRRIHEVLPLLAGERLSIVVNFY